MILRELRNDCLERLSIHYAIEEAQSFFYILSEYILDIAKVEIAFNQTRILTEAELQQFNSIIERLNNHEPIQYIVGETEFYGLKFKVNKDVLIPRPETEELVNWVINDSNKKPIKILDIGTGSGCIAITLAKHITNSQVTAFDVSDKALNIAQVNAKLNQVYVDFKIVDILDTTEYFQTYDVVISNPPYVRNLEKDKMHANVLDFEPHLALFVSDEDPLLFYRNIARFAKKSLNLRGILYFEINEYLGQDIIKLMKEEGFINIELRQDIFGKDRMIKGIHL